MAPQSERRQGKRAYEQEERLHFWAYTHHEHPIPPLFDLGIAQAAQGKFQEADKVFQEALSLAQQFEEHYGQCITLLNLATLAHEQGDHSTMMSYLKQGVEAAKQFGLLHYVQQSYELYKASASPEQQQGEFDALFQQAMDESSS
jgi:tetratricopeptide (TPR) repeat protein